MTYTIDEGRDIIAAVKRTSRVLEVGSQGVSSPLDATARDVVKSGKLGKVTLIRASYNRNTAGGAWIYPDTPGRHAADGELGRVSRQRAKEAVRSRPLLPVALLLGLLGRHRGRPLRPPAHDHSLRDGRHHAILGRGERRAVSMEGLAGSARHAQRHSGLPGGLHRQPELDLQQPIGQRVGVRDSRHRGQHGLPGRSAHVHARKRARGQPLGRRVVAARLSSRLTTPTRRSRRRSRPRRGSRGCCQRPRRGSSRARTTTSRTSPASSRRCARGNSRYEDAVVGHHAAAAAHMVNLSVRQRRLVEWDFAADTAKHT